MHLAENEPTMENNANMLAEESNDDSKEDSDGSAIKHAEASAGEDDYKKAAKSRKSYYLKRRRAYMRFVKRMNKLITWAKAQRLRAMKYKSALHRTVKIRWIRKIYVARRNHYIWLRRNLA